MSLSANLKEAIKARAGTQSGLTALIGTNPVRFWNVMAPQNTTATVYATFQIISMERIHVMGRDSLGRARIQIDSWGPTRETAENVNAQVVPAFNRWGGTVAGVVVKDTITLSEGIDVQPDEVSLIPRVTSEFEVVFEL